MFSCEFYEISKSTFFLRNTSGGCFCDYKQTFLPLFTTYLVKIKIYISLCYLYLIPLNHFFVDTNENESQNKVTKDKGILSPIQDGHFRGCSQMGGGKKASPP